MTQWHAISAEHAAQVLATSIEKGLSAQEAGRRLGQYGSNRLPSGEAVKLHRMLVRQFASILILILLAAAGLSFFMGDKIDGLAIIAIVIINALLGFVHRNGRRKRR